MPCLVRFYDATSGVKKLSHVDAGIDYTTLAWNPSVESSFAEFEQVISGVKFVSFLTPDMTSNNGIDQSVVAELDAMSCIFFDVMCGVKKLK